MYIYTPKRIGYLRTETIVRMQYGHSNGTATITRITPGDNKQHNNSTLHTHRDNTENC
jgi:hypothetical protein